MLVQSIYTVEWKTTAGDPLPDGLPSMVIGRTIDEVEKRVREVTGRRVSAPILAVLRTLEAGDRCEVTRARAGYRMSVLREDL